MTGIYVTIQSDPPGPILNTKSWFFCMYVCILIHSEDRILLAITIDYIKLKQSLDGESFHQVLLRQIDRLNLKDYQFWSWHVWSKIQLKNELVI